MAKSLSKKHGINRVRRSKSSPFFVPSDGDVKLSGSEPSFKGEVQIRLGDSWGAVCDTAWDMDDGEVVCRQLGYPGVKSVYQSQVEQGTNGWRSDSKSGEVGGWMRKDLLGAIMQCMGLVCGDNGIS